MIIKACYYVLLFIIFSSIIIAFNSVRVDKTLDSSVDTFEDDDFEDENIITNVNRRSAINGDNETVIEENVELNIEPDVKFIIWATRHGNRNPSKYFVANHYWRGWGEEGPLELNRRGKTEVFNFGIRFKNFLNGFTKRNYNASQIRLYTSSANRCQMTMQLVCAAIFRPAGYGVWRDHFDWSPVPYIIDDDVLRPYSKKCDPITRAWSPIDKEETQKIKEQLANNQDIIDYISKVATEFNFDKSQSYKDMGDVADNLRNYLLFRKQPPDFITQVNMSHYNETSLTQKIMTFMEGPQIACASDKECGYLMGGNWLNEIKKELLKKANESNNYEIKMIGYSSHTEIVLSLMKLMGIDQDELGTGCGFIIELRDKPVWSVKLLKHNTNYEGPRLHGHSITLANYTEGLKNISMGNGWIPLSNFTDYIEKNTIHGWDEICPTCTVQRDVKVNDAVEEQIPTETSHEKLVINSTMTQNSGEKIYSQNYILILAFIVYKIIF
uniref:Lysosomal acid phosphatase n=1 Tax=Parastrongyloides trichosuri TaxID=131310 RepID=A0A0N5A761_PARTI